MTALWADTRGHRAARVVLSFSVALVLSAITASCGGGAASPGPARTQTARVERGTVAMKVVASGSLSAVTSQRLSFSNAARVTSRDLGFPKAARVTEVNVRVGDMVMPGQVLAREDDGPFREVLSQRQAQLSQQQALLDAMANGNPSAGAAPSPDAQAARVGAARAEVAAARKAVDDTVLRAPAAGRVRVINGAVGELVGVADGAGAAAPCPGTDPSLSLKVTPAVTGEPFPASACGAPPTARPGRDGFIVLDNLNSFQVVVPFEESDAVKVAPNQKVRVTSNAFPGVTWGGIVLSIAPAGAAISGVRNYYAVILLSGTDPRIAAGQAVDAEVLVSSVDNVLKVPNAAVVKQGGRSLVNVPGPSGMPTPVPFRPGLVGDDTTEVESGLREGQEILLQPNQPPAGEPRGGAN